MKKFKEVPHVKGEVSSKIAGVFPELEYDSILKMIDSVVTDVNNKQFAIEVRKIALHIEKSNAIAIETFDAVIQITGIPTKVIDSLEESLNRPLTEAEILDAGLQIGFAVTRTRSQMQQELEAATKMLLNEIIKKGRTSAQAAESVIIGHTDALNLIKAHRGDPMRALLEVLSKHLG